MKPGVETTHALKGHLEAGHPRGRGQKKMLGTGWEWLVTGSEQPQCECKKWTVSLLWTIYLGEKKGSKMERRIRPSPQAHNERPPTDLHWSWNSKKMHEPPTWPYAVPATYVASIHTSELLQELGLISGEKHTSHKQPGPPSRSVQLPGPYIRRREKAAEEDPMGWVLQSKLTHEQEVLKSTSSEARVKGPQAACTYPGTGTKRCGTQPH